MPRISIVMPFRDAAATLPAALASLSAQSFRDWELLAVDDRSTDRSAEAIRGDARFRLLRNEEQPGIVGALVTGCRHADSAWLGRMDADDLSHPRRFERLLETAVAHPAWGVIGSRVGLADALGDGMGRYVAWVNSLLDPAGIAAARFIENPLIHPSVLMRRELADYRETAWAEDHDLWLRLLEAGVEIGKTPDTLLQWRDSPRRLTRTSAAYGTEARNRMRAHFLARMEAVRQSGVIIAGAGPIGKSLARALQTEGVVVRGFFEVSHRRIGETIHGAPVASSGELGRLWREAVLLSAVGVPGGREQVRALALAAGRQEGADFWCVC